jgi:hypothetical protein
MECQTVNIERGAVRSKGYATQARDFTGLQYGKITPTDIDALMDFQNKAFVLIEAKYTGGHMPFGQRLALERLVDIVEETGRKGLLLVAEHDNRDGDIDFAKAVVVEYRMKYVWKIPRVPLTVRAAIDNFLAFVERK